jgi:hypothetical protein
MLDVQLFVNSDNSAENVPPPAALVPQDDTSSSNIASPVTQSNPPSESVHSDVPKNEPTILNPAVSVDQHAILKEDLRHLVSQPNPREALDSLYWWIRKNRNNEKLDFLLVQSSDVLATVLTRALVQLRTEKDTDRSELKSSLEVLISGLVSCAIGDSGSISSKASSSISSNVKSILTEFCKLGGQDSRFNQAPELLGLRLAQIFSRLFRAASMENKTRLSHAQLSSKLLDCEKSLQTSGRRVTGDLQQLLFVRDKQLEKLELHIEISKHRVHTETGKQLFSTTENNTFLHSLGTGKVDGVVDKLRQEKLVKLESLTKDLSTVESQIALLQSRRSDLKELVVALERDIAKDVTSGGSSTDLPGSSLLACLSSLELSVSVGGCNSSMGVDSVVGNKSKDNDDEATLTSLCAFANAQAELVASIAKRVKENKKSIVLLAPEQVSILKDLALKVIVFPSLLIGIFI